MPSGKTLYNIDFGWLFLGWLVVWLAGWLVVWLSGGLGRSSVHWFFEWFVDLLFGWFLVCSLVGLFVGCVVVGSFLSSLVRWLVG